jgi:hypothetical protein
MASGALALVGGVLALTSAFFAWWSISGGGATISFFPGSSATASFGGVSMTQTYASVGLGQVGGLYEAIFALAIVGGILAIVAGIVGMAGGAGRIGTKRIGTGKGLVIAAIVLIVVAVALGPAMQPWALNQGNGHSTTCGSGNGTTPCSAYWGSQTNGGVTATWGAAAGWYLALVGLILGIVGLVLWWSARKNTMSAPAAPN